MGRFVDEPALPLRCFGGLEERLNPCYVKGLRRVERNAGACREEVMQSPDSSLLEILRCPASGARLIREGDWLYSVSESDPRRYPIRDGIPVMLADASETVSADEQRAVLQRIES